MAIFEAELEFECPSDSTYDAADLLDSVLRGRMVYSLGAVRKVEE